MTKTKNKQSKSAYAHRSSRAWLWVLVIIGLMILIAALVIWWQNSQTQPVNLSNESTPTVTSPSGNSHTTPTDEEDDKRPTQYEGANPNTLDELTGSLAYVHPIDGTLQIVAMIDQYLETPGTCTLTVTDAAGKVIATATGRAYADVTTSVCEQFNLSLANFTNGQYHIAIQLSADGKTGNISGEVTL